MKEIITHLINFGFSKTEAIIYATLLKIGKANGYRLTKELGVAKSTVYQTLDLMYKNGYVLMIPGSTREYEAKDPELLFCDLEKKFSENMKGLKYSLSRLKIKREKEFFYKIQGMENISKILTKIIDNATDEIYINSDFKLLEYRDSLRKAIERGVRVIIFSFNKVDDMGLDIEVYHKSNVVENYSNPTRIMIVADLRYSFVVTKRDDSIDGIYTNDEIFIKIISEHIHGDIYMAKLASIYEESFDEKIKIDTLHEHKNLIR